MAGKAIFLCCISAWIWVPRRANFFQGHDRQPNAQAVDLGTSACKFLLVDETGKVCNQVSREYPLSMPHTGWSKQDPSSWWQACLDGIPALLEGFDPAQVQGIGMGGQMHGLVALDAADKVLRPAILWNDGRTARQTDYLNKEIGRETLSKYTGNIAFAGFTAPKILWMKENEPELYAAIAKIMLPKDYLVYRMTGVHATDYSDASGMLLLDVEHKCWSKEMCEICGVKEEWLAHLYESWQFVGTLKPDAAAALGLPESVKVCAGAGDNAAAAVGTGTVGEGHCNISLGTSGTVFISSEKFGVDATNGLHAFAHADGGWHLMGCMLSAASCNKWWMDDILKVTDKDYHAETLAEIATIVDGPISGEVKATTTDAETMVKEGEAIYALDPKHMVVKIPMTAEGLKAIKALSAKGIPTNCTLIFSANQALLAARAGATYVSPFLGRLDDISQRGIELIETIHDMFLNYPDIETQIIAASVRNPIHVTDCALAGSDIATVPYKVIEQMLHHPLTDSGIEKFKEDYCKVFGE